MSKTSKTSGGHRAAGWGHAASAGGSAFGHPPALMLWVALVVLVLARATLAFVPSMALWGLNVQRFLAPAWAWLPWALAALTVLPPVARVLTPPLEAFGRAIERAPLAAGFAAAIVAATLVGAFPDRLHYVGDFLMRIGAVRKEESPDVLSPQAYPLDVLVHYAAPLNASNAGWMSAEMAVRWIGGLGAALLAAFSVLFARAIDAGPAARAAAFAVMLFGGYLCLYTGESKAFAEMVVAVAGFAAFALGAVQSAGAAHRGKARGDVAASGNLDARGARARGEAAAAPGALGARGGAAPRSENIPSGGGALLGAGLCLGTGVLFHRFALGLVPAWLVTAFVWLRAYRGRALRSVPALLGCALPLVVLGAMAPRLVSTIATYDLGANFDTAETRASGGMLAAALALAHLLDVANVLLFLSPLALVALVMTFARGRAAGAHADAPHPALGEGALMLALVVPFTLVMMFARPPQGPVRDWDSFAMPAAALSVGAAWVIARTIDRSRAPWLAAAVVLAVAAPAVQWLAHHADAPRGRARLEALMAGPPERAAADRARTWYFLGWSHFESNEYDAAARAFERASDAAPSPRNLTHWAMAETMRGDDARALALYSRAVERDSNFTLGWFGVGVSAINAGQRADAERAARALARLAPENPKTREIAEWVDRTRP